METPYPVGLCSHYCQVTAFPMAQSWKAKDYLKHVMKYGLLTCCRTKTSYEQYIFAAKKPLAAHRSVTAQKLSWIQTHRH